jgi:hypothetical protein
MYPMVLVGRANPPVNLKGGDGGSFDSGKLRSTGNSCSHEIVWLAQGQSDARTAKKR